MYRGVQLQKSCQSLVISGVSGIGFQSASLDERKAIGCRLLSLVRPAPASAAETSMPILAFRPSAGLRPVLTKVLALA